MSILAGTTQVVKDKEGKITTDRRIAEKSEYNFRPDPPSEEEISSAGDEQSRASRRFQEQCFLMDNLNTFKKKVENKNYSNFLKVDTKKPQLLISKLSTSNKVGSFVNATPTQLSGLVPYIKIFKVFYPTAESPGEEYELSFNNHLTEESLKVMSQTRRGRGAGSGIKSFDWKLNGSNPAEAERLIEATLTLSFQNINDLVEKQSLTSAGSEKEERSIGFIDLIHQQNKYNSSEDAASSREYNEKYFRIKAQVGWSIPKKWLDENGNEVNGSEYAQAIDQAGYTFFLTMVKHDLDFKEDGTIELTINYMAAMEGLLSDKRTDILLMGDNLIIAELEEKIKRYKKEVSKIKKKRKDNKISEQDEKIQLEVIYEKYSLDEEDKKANNGLWKYIKNMLFDEEKKNVMEGLERAIRLEKSNIYSNFLTEVAKRGGIYGVEISSDEIGEWEKEDSAWWNFWSDDSFEQESAEETSTKRINSKSKSKPSWENKISEQPSYAFSDLRTSASEFAKQTDDINARENLSISSFAAPDKNSVKINYIYFGSILEAALSVVNENKALAEIANMVGPFEYVDPRTGKKKRINIADIPISLNLFNMWFFDKCIAPQRNKWLLKEFLQAAIKTLIAAALNPNCFGEDFKQSSTKVYMNTLQFALNDDKTCRVAGTNSIKNFNRYGFINLDEKLNRDDGFNLPQGQEAAGLKFQSYLFLFANDVNLFTLGPPDNGESFRETRDIQDYGIYHFRIGADRGLVKSIKFKKNDAPHIGAARIAQDGPGLLAMRELYNADVEMFGNAIWKPGSIVFLDASDTALGASSISHNSSGEATGYTSVSQALGLGGYYFITSVNSYIESGNYKTELNCIWQASGTGKGPGSDARKGDGSGASTNSTTDAKSKASTPPSVSEGPVVDVSKQRLTSEGPGDGLSSQPEWNYNYGEPE